ncbi:MAG: acetate--CoA ligase family protein [Candidatus Binatia bacterium]
MPSRLRVLSEYDSKAILRSYGVPTVAEALAADADEAAARAKDIGFPVAVKLCAEGLAHKSERSLVRLGLGGENDVRFAAQELLARRRADEASAKVLVQRMVSGRRELIIGLMRDRQFGPCVMLGLGGVLAEVLRDVVFRVAPISREDALEMANDLKAARLLGPFRGEPAVDRDLLAAALVGVARLGMERPEVVSVDVNPLVVCGAEPVAVDALVETDVPV